MGRSLAEWLGLQESLSPHEIDLGLDRIGQVAARLPIAPPPRGVFTVAGTNGKGSTVSFLDHLLAAGGRSTGVYTSPHLVRYNERIRVNGHAVTDRHLTDAFEQIEIARRNIPLTFFEYGTLAALLIFSAEACDTWLLEVGLGGRLDAVNLIDPDFTLITTIALDHQDWLGDTLEEIGAEKAGIMRPTAPAFFGGARPPASIMRRADELGTSLRYPRHGFNYERTEDAWCWRGADACLNDLPLPDIADVAQLDNFSLALAAAEACDPALLDFEAVQSALASTRPGGRFQIVPRAPEWVLDVAHNPEAAGVLRGRLDALGQRTGTTAVIGMLADKQVEPFVNALSGAVDRWIIASVDDVRAADGAELAAAVGRVAGQPVEYAGNPAAAFARAEAVTVADGRVLCCGSFRIVGPALEWLGLY